ncbi:hypothetical protein [Streptomyces sp. NPDC048527]|uniref:hypothetical protein n=1 Tax=Streptomyces sp. NPDC048527 TaxID=3365568 RepID=UPI0037198B83
MEPLSQSAGLKHAADTVADDAFTGAQGQLGITAACRLTDCSRATHYRHQHPVPRVSPAW